mgnify:FL=1
MITNTYDRRQLPAFMLAQDYKARGLGRSRSWSQFVIDKGLRPDMDAEDFYSIYDCVSADLLEFEPPSMPPPPATPEQNQEFADYGKRVRVSNDKGHVTEGTVQRTLAGSSGTPVYEVLFDGFDSTFRTRLDDVIEWV